MGKSGLTKAQVFYSDFVVGTLIVVTAILIYYNYIGYITAQNSGSLNDLITDINTISSNMITAGSPENWTSSNVQRVGLTNNKQRLSYNNIAEFENIAYNESRKILSTRFDYVLYFERWDGTIIPIENKCAIGNPIVVTDNTTTCQRPNITLANPKRSVKDIRLAIYDNEILQMIIYLWE